MHDQSASRISGRTRAAVSAMCVRALRITVLKSAGNFTRDECHDLSAEKIQRVKCLQAWHRITLASVCTGLSRTIRPRCLLRRLLVADAYADVALTSSHFAMLAAASP